MTAFSVFIEESVSQGSYLTHLRSVNNPQEALAFIVETAKDAITGAGLWVELLMDAVDYGLDEYSIAFDDGVEVWDIICERDQEAAKRHAEALLSDHNIVSWLNDFNGEFDVKFKNSMLTLRKLLNMLPPEVKLTEDYDEIFWERSA